jgi:hypothetical protein
MRKIICKLYSLTIIFKTVVKFYSLDDSVVFVLTQRHGPPATPSSTMSSLQQSPAASVTKPRSIVMSTPHWEICKDDPQHYLYDMYSLKKTSSCEKLGGSEHGTYGTRAHDFSP